MRLLRWCCLPLLITWMGVALAQGEATRLAPWTLLDQFDRPYTLEPDLRVLLVARGMDASGLLDEALAELGGDYLERHSVVFLADISGMPAPIASLFAVPAMRDYGYRVMLDRSGRVASRYPGEKAELLWLDLDNGELRGQRQFTDVGALRQALQALGQ